MTYEKGVIKAIKAYIKQKIKDELLNNEKAPNLDRIETLKEIYDIIEHAINRRNLK